MNLSSINYFTYTHLPITSTKTEDATDKLSEIDSPRITPAQIKSTIEAFQYASDEELDKIAYLTSKKYETEFTHLVTKATGKARSLSQTTLFSPSLKFSDLRL